MTAARHIVMAMDAGGSATRCAVIAGDGAVLGIGTGGPANHILGGWEIARTSLTAAATAALRAAGRDSGEVAVDIIVAGSAGVGADGEGREPVESLLAETVPQAGRVRVIGDMTTAFWGALSMPVGVVVSAGTGSVCFGRNLTGETCQVGGWGPLMGDEGSAHDIGMNALRAVARATDGRGEPTVLGELLCHALGADSPIEIALRLYGGDIERERIASLAVHVAAAARQRDAVAIRILRRAGKELAIAASTALRTLKLLSTPVSVSYSGSVFEAGRFVSEPFARTVNDASALAKVEPPLLPPIGGAFRLGLQALGITMDEPIVHRLAKGLLESGF